MRKPPLLTLVAALLAASWGASLGVLHLRGDIPVVDGVEATLTNFRTTLLGRHTPPDIVTIVAIDDDTARQAGAYPLPRATLAKIVTDIQKSKPKAIALDMLLVDAGPEEGDKALTDALGQGNTVLAAAAVFPESRQQIADTGENLLTGLPKASELLLPQRRFTDAAAVGFVNVQTDKSGAPRFVPMFLRSGTSIVPSFPLRVATLASGADPVIEPDGILLGNREVGTDIGHMLPLSFYGPRGTIRTVSATAALNGQIPENVIKDHIVVIGATVTGGGDVFPTPFDPVFPGAEVVSTAITHLMAGDGLVRDHNVRLIDAGLAVALSVLLIGLLAWQRSAIGIATILSVIFLWAMVNLAAFAHGIWLSAALPMAAAGPPAVLFGAAQLLLGRRQAHHFAQQSQLLQRVQAPGLTEFLARNPDFLTQPVRQEAAVVFIDINGFTGLSETIGPTAVRELLNDFYNLIDDEVIANNGAIISFMGDGAMILFGLPQPGPQDATNALRCCVRLADRTRRWLEGLPEATASRIGFKIGAHFGTIVASRLGGGSRQQITATGDTVNVASRLMEVAAHFGNEVAISDELLKVAGRDSEPFQTGTLDGPMETQLRGRAGSIAVWLWKI
ncbi:adenylate/guanylate cyclase domain-containing protein [Rhizobium sp. BK376]|uniref:CHASE2 domain-containing protein n=1 Tax=Rhizobium sp. BK376 TaxID=2512149 RepID=UPI00104BFF02|nr:adenylate/guanylate cyclase domain-containing protein [Rhizobium sp. BK376]TCR82227.1 adenylate cyclase [Rhizobium sp. BK376]